MKTFGKPTAPRGIPTVQLKGGITQEDLIRLEMRKKELYLDYNKADKYLMYIEAKNNKTIPQNAIVPVKQISLRTQSD